MQFYEMIFEVTETCNNGNERRKKVSVYSPSYRKGVILLRENRIADAIKVLEAKHYYNIVWLNTKIKELLTTEE